MPPYLKTTIKYGGILLFYGLLLALILSLLVHKLDYSFDICHKERSRPLYFHAGQAELMMSDTSAIKAFSRSSGGEKCFVLTKMQALKQCYHVLLFT